MASDQEIIEAQERYGLGALPFLDPRSREYPVRALVPEGLTYPDRSYTWSCPIVLNQANTGTCVGHAFAHELAARPQSWPVAEVPDLNYLAKLIYLEACKRDPWSQNDQGDLYFGTDTLSAVKVLKDLGFFGSYRWAFGHADLRLARGYLGPVIYAVPWFNSMFFPGSDGRITVDESSGMSGWHALLSVGQNIYRREGLLHNSWGKGWGQDGRATISFEDEEKLIGMGATAMVPLNRTYL